MAARASAARSAEAVATSPQRVVRKFGRPPAVDSSIASTYMVVAESTCSTQEKAPNRLAGPESRCHIQQAGGGLSIRSLWRDGGFCADNLVKDSFSRFLETFLEIFGSTRCGHNISRRTESLSREPGN